MLFALLTVKKGVGKLHFVNVQINLIRWVGLLCICAFKPDQTLVHTTGTEMQGALLSWLSCMLVTITLPQPQSSTYQLC